MTIDPSDADENPDFSANLDGTWKSNWQLTRQHMETDCKLSEEAILGFELLMGKMTVRYTGTQAEFKMPEIRYTKVGKERVIDGWTSELAFNILGRTNSQIALLLDAIAPPVDQESIQLITFENVDTYWVYLGNVSFSDLHVREYFSRQTPE